MPHLDRGTVESHLQIRARVGDGQSKSLPRRRLDAGLVELAGRGPAVEVGADGLLNFADDGPAEAIDVSRHALRF